MAQITCAVMSVLDRYIGCILGLACGDALGGPVEFMSATQIAREHGRVTEMVGGGWLGLAPGEYTDDTQMMLCILESIVDRGFVDPPDIASRFVAWLETGPKDVGNLTRQSIRKITSGYSWELAGRMAWEDSGMSNAANGGLMRTAPVGLACAASAEDLVKGSRETCLITHYDERCQQSCIAVNAAISHLVHGNEPTTESITAAIGTEIHPEVAAAIAVPTDIPESSDGGYTIECLRIAWTALMTARTFEEGVAWTVNLGGDADTNGAVVGALLGAKFGATGIPSRWLDKLQNADVLTKLATRIWEIAGSPDASNKSTRKLP